MTKEQEKAIYRLNLGKNIPISSECCIVNVKDIETVLSMLEEKDKTIDLMAEYIESKKILVDKYCYALTKETIKQYFENKVNGGNER